MNKLLTLIKWIFVAATLPITLTLFSIGFAIAYCREIMGREDAREKYMDWLDKITGQDESGEND